MVFLSLSLFARLKAGRSGIMPRLRFYNPEKLEQLTQSDSRLGKEENEQSERRNELLERAASRTLSRYEYAELLWEVHNEPTFRELAVDRGTSAATEMRRRKDERPNTFAHLKRAIIAMQIADSLALQRGITIDPANGRQLASCTGYLVSLGTFGKRMTFAPTFCVIDHWLKKNAALLSDFYPGGWYDEKSQSYWLDFNVWLPSAGEAHVKALTQRQCAYYDLANRREIRVQRDAERKAA
jgi:hypothetical protein